MLCLLLLFLWVALLWWKNKQNTCIFLIFFFFSFILVFPSAHNDVKYVFQVMFLIVLYFLSFDDIANVVTVFRLGFHFSLLYFVLCSFWRFVSVSINLIVWNDVNHCIVSCVSVLWTGVIYSEMCASEFVHNWWKNNKMLLLMKDGYCSNMRTSMCAHF